jgi:Ras-related C3 botulinum toxin substrate 1
MFFFLATKIDLRQNPRKPLISTEEGEDLSKKIYANRFIESSAKENIHVKDAIHEAVRAAIKGPVVAVEEEKRHFSLFSCC